ncbi:MAG: hypothetical protein ABSF95_21635 [Verrucomicrobiota bacterium]|jgi:hypothetical protein
MNGPVQPLTNRPSTFEERYRLYLDESGDHVFNHLEKPSHRFLCLLGCWFRNPEYLSTGSSTAICMTGGWKAMARCSSRNEKAPWRGFLTLAHAGDPTPAIWIDKNLPHRHGYARHLLTFFGILRKTDRQMEFAGHGRFSGSAGAA